MFFGWRPRLLDRALAHLYFAASAGDWADRSDDDSHMATLVVGLEHVHSPKRILDVGTGGGSSAALLADRFPDSRVSAIDSVGAMVEIARGRHQRGNLDFRKASAEKLPYGDGEFDLVTCLNALPELEEIRRVTVPGAQLLRANTYFPMVDGQRHWVDRWREMGFVRQTGANVGRGSWELYTRSG
jgi:ubiquinone/menaquinone biosynthesis C-methylase UbiE